jgi:hypothetical protein
MGKGWRYEMKGENVMTIPNFLSLYRLSFTSIVTVSDCSLKSPALSASLDGLSFVSKKDLGSWIVL